MAIKIQEYPTHRTPDTHMEELRRHTEAGDVQRWAETHAQGTITGSSARRQQTSGSSYQNVWFFIVRGIWNSSCKYYYIEHIFILYLPKTQIWKDILTTF